MSTFFLCCAKSLNDQIAELSKAGKKGKIAADLCLEILEEIRKNGLVGDFLLSKRTKRGERRFDKCVKYNLGTGYRLITVRHKDHLFIPFVGTHDKADLWFEHNKPDTIFKMKKLYNVEKVSWHQLAHSNDLYTSANVPSGDEYEENLLNKLDEETLRMIFVGLVEQS